MLARALTFFLGASATLAAPKAYTQGRTCGSNPSPETIASAEAHFANHFAINAYNIDATYNLSVTIPLYWHVIQQNNTAEGGYITADQMASQICVLNDAYSPVGITFELAGSDYTTNADWFANIDGGSSQNDDAKQQLREGDEATLNIYSTGLTDSPDLLGYSTFPWGYASNPQDDGVVFLFSTIPGGPDEKYNLGYTLIHEVGHWLGLYHPFQGGCTSPNDYVSDTPEEASHAFGCPTNRDSCKNDAGFDPIHNFMDYTDDSCKDQFTAGQFTRITQQIALYRGIQ